MNVKVYRAFLFLGEYSVKSICQESEIISVGTVIQIDNDTYTVGNVIIKCDGIILLEVY
ncbi:hypothetical protein [Bacillus sp. FDAARGOS_235]|uniref:hypothetical protein n=1 Tax=Bacillus sp. FDAARGOS_235 TaxID=1839798 RepID=UPI0015CFC11F|nr:hypothetical protein [Bacillus sp. FDAARGOS_235]